jgi:histidine triad (HIT) family protein
MESCVFCKIVEKTEPASVVYEDDSIIAFMTIRPIHPGECIIIPKEHIDHFTDIPDNIAAHIMVIAQRIGRKIKEKFKPLRVGMVVHGFGVPHAHLVLVPQHSPFDITSARYAYIENGQIKFSASRVPLASREELDAIARALSL